MEIQNTRYIMRRNLQLLNVKHVWIYVYIMNGSRLGFHDVQCGVHIFTSSERFTMRQDYYSSHTLLIRCPRKGLHGSFGSHHIPFVCS